MPHSKPSVGRSAAPSPRLTLCLAIDLKESTASGLALSSRKLDRFNLALINQLEPHLEAVQLDEALVKFTGDGWLVMSDEQEDAPALCCLALLVASRFRGDIAGEVGIAAQNVPALRLALCWGRDLHVTLRNGQRDFVGNSVRRAVRAGQLSRDDEVLIDDTVRTWVAQDFRTVPVDVEARLRENPGAKWEESLVLHVLEELRTEAANDPDAPVCYVNTLAVSGRRIEAGSLVERISDRLVQESLGADTSQDEILANFNDLLKTDVDYATANFVLSDLIKAGLRPDRDTYHRLIQKSRTPDTESQWLWRMALEGIDANEETFEILVARAPNEEVLQQRVEQMIDSGVRASQATIDRIIDQAPDQKTAAQWFDRLRQAGLGPGRGAFESLVHKSESFSAARYWIEQMLDAGYEPSEEAFVAMFGKGVLDVPADELLRWYLGLRVHPTHPIKRAIGEYRKAGRIADALRLCLDYPHTDAALKTIRNAPDEAISYFRSIVEQDPNHPNGAYALGLALIELGDFAEATPWLRRAHELAAPGPRRDELGRYLRLLDGVAGRAS